MPTPADLHMAISHRNAFAVEHLLHIGAINLSTPVRGATPLSLALYRGCDDIVRTLTNAGADVNLFSQDHLGRIETPLGTACRLGSYAMVWQLLQTPHIDVDKRDFFNKTPLWIATKEKRADLVELLLNYGADVNLADTWAECPLYLATSNKGRSGIAELLIYRGCRVNIADSEGRTPLYWAIQRANKKVFVLLLQAGAKVGHPSWIAPANLPLQWREDAEFVSWIREVASGPLPLAWLARAIVRRWLSLRWKQVKFEQVDQLPLPDALKDYMLLGSGRNKWTGCQCQTR